MEIITVEELMVPVDEYATVSKDATLFEAIMALEKAQELQDRKKYHYLHRGILVRDKNKKIVGRISQLDVLRALEPKYKQIGDTRAISRAGFSPQFLRSMIQNYALCETSLIDMSGRGARIKVKDFMYTPEEGEYVESDARLCEAIHMLVIGHHQRLLVVSEGEIVGVLRLVDVFMKIFELMKQCEIGME